jgi:hypothetical protein
MVGGARAAEAYGVAYMKALVNAARTTAAQAVAARPSV